MAIKSINDFKLPVKEKSNKLKIEQLVGFISRKSKVFILSNDNLELINYKEANEKFMLWVENTFNKISNEYSELNIYKYKIEHTSDRIAQLGKKLIEDYSFEYTNTNEELYKTKSQLYLVKLEQLFIQNKYPSCYLEEFIKPNISQEISNWIHYVTYDTSAKKKHEKMNLLKEYLDEYLQFLFDKPKSIWSINKITLPLSIIDRKQIKSIEQYAGYFSRSSIVTISSITKTHMVLNELANNDIMIWIKSIFGKDSEEIKKLEMYRSKIESLSENVISLGNELIEDYNNINYNTEKIEKNQCLIDLEQYLFRYNKEPEFVIEVYRASEKKKKQTQTDNLPEDWIIKITGGKKNKIKILVEYLNEYYEHVLDRKRKILDNDLKIDRKDNKKNFKF